MMTNKISIREHTVNLGIMLLLMAFPIIAAAQSVSGVTGTVTDTTGAVIPGATVTLLDTKTQSELTATTNDQGIYLFTNVKPGSDYKLTFVADDFQTFVLSDVTLGIAKTETYNAELIAGQIAETVEVISTTGDATLNVSDASIGNVIGTKKLRELPIQIRNSPAALIGLQPGVIGNNVGASKAVFSNSVGSVTGARADQSNVTIDGIDANDQASQQAFATIANAPIDSVQEFRAVSTNPGASEGRSSGGQIQLATKSGSNEFHGSLREYYRTEKTAANTFFNNRSGIERPRLRRHQFGGNLGGPLPFFNFGEGGPLFRGGKDKLFFFFDYEGRRDNSQKSVLRQVPLQHFRDGRIAYINNNAGCTSRSRLDTTPNCISFLSQAQIAALDPQGVGGNRQLLAFINSRYPAANDFSAGDGVNTGGLRFNAPFTRTDNTYTARVDWNITDYHKGFVRTTITRRNSTYRTGVAHFPGDPDSRLRIDKSYSWVVGHSWIISPTLFNQVTIGVSNSVLDFPVPDAPSFPNSFTLGAGLTNPFPSLSPQDRTVTTPTIRNDMTWTKGSHTFQFGGQFKPIRQKSSLTNDFNFVTLGIGGDVTELDAELRPQNILSAGPSQQVLSVKNNFDRAFTSILGRFAQIRTRFNYSPDGTAFAPGTGKKRNHAYNEYEIYFSDSWRIRNDLTLNLGVRWHFYPAPYEKNGFQATNDVDFSTLWNQRLQNGASGISGNAAEPFLSYTLNGKANNGRPLYRSSKNNFSPRLGFSYNPSFDSGILGKVFGSRKTALRGGFSLVYDRVGGAVTFIQDQLSYVFDNSASTRFGTLNPAEALLNDPRFTALTVLPVQNDAPTITQPLVPFVTNGRGIGLANRELNYAVSQDFKIPYSYQWNLGVQRELPGNMLLDVSYVGRSGKKLFSQSDAAQVIDFIDPASGQSMLAAFNALQAQIQSGAATIPQPWIENQVLAGIRSFKGPKASCVSLEPTQKYPNCTQLVRASFRRFVESGSTARLLQQLHSKQFLNPNVGLSSQFASNLYITNHASSSYNAMLVSLRKRFSKGFEFDVNYTWSRAIDNESNITNTVVGGLICDSRDLKACRSDADFDIRHLFNANGIWELPFGRGRLLGTKNMSKWLDAVIGGWTVSGIVTMRSGLPVNSNSGSYPVGFFRNTPSVIANNSIDRGDSNVRDEGTGIQYFADPKAVNDSLRFPRHGESGNRNTFRSLGFWSLDLAISKKWKMPWAERHLITFRVEAFNATNNNSFDVPNITLNSTSFGQITDSLSSPRDIQFSLRYDF